MNLKQKKYDLMNTRKGLLDEAKAILMKDGQTEAAQAFLDYLQTEEAMAVFEKSGVTMWECRNCGHIVVGTKAPEICPVCKHPQAFFEVRAENY